MARYPHPKLHLDREIERREIRNAAGYVRQYVRYQGQRRWYRALSTASIAFQHGDDCDLSREEAYRKQAEDAGRIIDSMPRCMRDTALPPRNQ